MKCDESSSIPLKLARMIRSIGTIILQEKVAWKIPALAGCVGDQSEWTQNLYLHPGASFMYGQPVGLQFLTHRVVRTVNLYNHHGFSVDQPPVPALRHVHGDVWVTFFSSCWCLCKWKHGSMRLILRGFCFLRWFWCFASRGNAAQFSGKCLGFWTFVPLGDVLEKEYAWESTKRATKKGKIRRLVVSPSFSQARSSLNCC